MKRVMLSIFLMFAVGGVGSVAAQGAPGVGGNAWRAIGLWGGVDPLDGGYAQRSFTMNEDGTLTVVGRESNLSLCDGTDKGVLEGVAELEGDTLVVDPATITCFNNGQSAALRDVYEFDRLNGTLIETSFISTGEAVTRIVLHRVSLNR